MTEYIERKAAVESFMGEFPDVHYPSWYAEKLKEIPAADVIKVRHGEWVFIDDVNDEDTRYYCSLCQAGDVHKKEFNVPYCWMCGAYMNGKGESDA